MSFDDKNFMEFGGDPITGRVPTRLTVHGGELTGQQAGEVQKQYKLFCDCKFTAVGSYLSRNRILSDGSRLRMTSANGLDHIEVWVRPGGGRPLELPGYIIYPTDEFKTTGWDTNVEGAKISPDVYVAAPDTDKEQMLLPPDFVLHTKLKAGAVNWIASDGRTLSWDHGGNNRYATNAWDRIFVGEGTESLARRKRHIYYRGVQITTPTDVFGAAVLQGKIIYIGAYSRVYYAPSPLSSIDDAFARGEFRREIAPNWILVTSAEVVLDDRVVSAWHFNPAGTRAAAVVVKGAVSLAFTWSWATMMRQAVPQVTRYLDFEVTTSGELVVTASEQVFASEPVGPLMSGAPIGYQIIGDPEFTEYFSDLPRIYDFTFPRAESGPLTFRGRRLIGVDFDAEGNEIQITYRVAGTGSVTSIAPETEGAEVRSSTSYSVAWSIYFNDTLVVNVPTEVVGLGGRGYLGTPTAAAEYVTLHALDARFGVAVYERLVRTATGYDDFTNATATLSLEAIYGLEPILSTPITPPPNTPIAAALSSSQVGLYWEQQVVRGLRWYSVYSGGPNDPAWCSNAPYMPQTIGWYGENLVSHIRQSQWLYQGATRPNTEEESHWPNQVTSALLYATTFLTLITVASGSWAQLIRFGPFESGGGAITSLTHFNTGRPDIVYYAFLYPDGYKELMERVVTGDGVAGERLVSGFAKKNYDTRHFLLALKNSQSRGFFNMIATFQQLQAGVDFPVPPKPTVALYAFTKSEAPEAIFVPTDILPALAQKLAEEEEADLDSLRSDPVRAI